MKKFLEELEALTKAKVDSMVTQYIAKQNPKTAAKVEVTKPGLDKDPVTAYIALQNVQK